MSLIANYSKKIIALMSSVGTEEFPHKMIGLLGSLVPINDATIIVYPPKRLPIIDYFQPQADGTSLLDQFVNGAFLLDPYYITGTAGNRFGFFHLKEISPDQFKTSEYYRTFYSKSGYQDECGYIFPMIGGGFAQISLARTREYKKFRKAQLQLLGDVFPLVQELGRQHWSGHDDEKDNGSIMKVQLQSALEMFGSSVLTKRQMQVINLLLHGNSTKVVAEKLGISIETVKLHRKHAYAELDISSQGELFYLFLDSLMSVKKYSGGDTLINYL